MSEKINNKTKLAILGFIGIGLGALLIVAGLTQVGDDATVNISDIENNEEVINTTNEENSSEASEITAEKVIPNEDDQAVDIEEDSNN